MSGAHVCEGDNEDDIRCVRGRVIIGIDPYGDTQSWDDGPCRCACHRDLAAAPESPRPVKTGKGAKT